MQAAPAAAAAAVGFLLSLRSAESLVSVQGTEQQYEKAQLS
jgi:hypothetical protein